MKVRLRGAGVDGTLSLTVPNDCSLEGLEQAAAEHGACALPPPPTKAGIQARAMPMATAPLTALTASRAGVALRGASGGFRLSLNKKDPLVPPTAGSDSLLKAAGLCSGDLVFLLAPPGGGAPATTSAPGAGTAQARAATAAQATGRDHCSGLQTDRFRRCFVLSSHFKNCQIFARIPRCDRRAKQSQRSVCVRKESSRSARAKRQAARSVHSHIAVRQE